MDRKKLELPRIYDEFETAAADFKKSAACHKGCAFCCTDAGSIDMTTLEGLVVREAILKLPRAGRLKLKKGLARDVKRREKGQASSCPFLQKNNACMIYPVRPFACRRIYSVHTCSRTHPPMLDRRVMEIGRKTIQHLQQLDDTGYSGHITYILQMLETPAFLSVYLSGEFNPAAVMAFGKSHGIVINRLAD